MDNEKVPKVSVCVVTYNQEKYIRQCLQSIVDQETNFDFEVIVGDDCSTDGTRAIIQEFAKKYQSIIKPIFHAQNLGMSRNYQLVHEAATGDFIAHIDGDDFWLPSKLQSQISFLHNHPECVAVYSNAIVVDDNQSLLGVFNNQQPISFDTNYLLQKGNFLNHSSLMYRSFLKKEILEIPKKFIDYRVHLRFSFHGKLGYINQALVVYRNIPTSATSVSSNTVRLLYWETITDEISQKETIHSQLKNSASSFFSTIICTSILQKDLRDIYFWAKKIRQDILYDFFKIILIGSILAIKRILIAGITKILFRKKIIILFKR